MKLFPAARNPRWFLLGAILGIVPVCLVAVAGMASSVSIELTGAVILLSVVLIYTQFLALMGYLNVRILAIVGNVSYSLAMLILVVMLSANTSEGLGSAIFFMVAFTWTFIIIIGGLTIGVVAQTIANVVRAIKENKNAKEI